MTSTSKKRICIIIGVVAVSIIICVIIALISTKNENSDGKENKENNNIYEISYAQSYSKQTKTYTFTISNITEDLYVSDGENKYKGNSDKKVIITGIEEGIEKTYIIDKETPTKDSKRKITVKFPYFNPYYNTEKCKGYNGKIAVCSKQFLDYEVSEDLVDTSIKNYHTTYND